MLGRDKLLTSLNSISTTACNHRMQVDLSPLDTLLLGRDNRQVQLLVSVN